jgi:hypothetical protein
MSDHRRNAAITLLSRMLAGLSMTAPSHHGVEDEEPDFSATAIMPLEETGLFFLLSMPSGDVFRVIVDWVPEESP